MAANQKAQVTIAIVCSHVEKFNTGFESALPRCAAMRWIAKYPPHALETPYRFIETNLVRTFVSDSCDRTSGACRIQALKP